MSDINGLDALNQRMARASRTVPPPRRPAAAVAQPQPDTAATPETPSTQTPVQATIPAQRPNTTPPQRPRSRPKPPAAPVSPLLPVDEPQANLMVRVRRSLDLRLDSLIHELRHRANIRTNKTEIIEMLLWELPEQPSPELEDRLNRYRLAVPRR